MTGGTANKAASSRWPDLPIDLLCDVSRRFHDDPIAYVSFHDDPIAYVRFHAICKPWRDSLLPAPCRPAFLPWLVTQRDGTGYRRARCVFSSGSSGCRATTTTETRIRDRGWVISSDDGTARASLLTPGSEDDPTTTILLSGTAATVTAPVPEWVESTSGIVSGDGTIFLHGFGLVVSASKIPRAYTRASYFVLAAQN
ncbi:hypothetical protein PR202_ga24608 [Eleusine coracana subsp. coracana]|uniref:Uncharacterized protein n=1 Tax=Eleusine coracana subsp. coracana TaxID=191504 RepID=A0AAV5D783_ELECO|nr:hypothetical protein PR202_ga24608 [Eleusine coracana subsp. coracana]